MTKVDLQTDDPETVEINFIHKENKKVSQKTITHIWSFTFPGSRVYLTA